jgi:hypothetical protein
MLEVNLNRRDAIVERSISERCSVYGRVATVEVHREPSPFALIAMCTRDLTECVASHFQGSIFGCKALVRLTQGNDEGH